MPPKMEIAGDTTDAKSVDKPKPTPAPSGARIVGRMPEDFRDRGERRTSPGTWIDEFGRIRTGS